MSSASVIADKAMSEMLVGPDWALNLELCDVINSDPSQAKEVIKTIKKRLTNRSPMVQLLALTVLETLVKNCGDNVHQQVQDRGVLQEMVKIVKKKADMRVRDRILVLIDIWQEAFGGPRGRYPQYYKVYSQLQNLGVDFPRRGEEDMVPIFTPPQSRPIASPHRPLSSGRRSSVTISPNSEADIHIPAMSLTDIQNTRGIIEVLSEMLNALPPRDRMALREEVIVDLVDQCRTNQRAVMHLVNTTSDEEVLRQGLSLNDELQRVLAKHDALASGAPMPVEPARRLKQEEDHRPASQRQEATGTVPLASKPSTSMSALVPPPQENSKKPVAVTSSTANAESQAPPLDLLSGDPIDPFAPAVPPPAPTEQYGGQQLSLLALPPPEDSGNPFGSTSFHATPSSQQPINGSSQPSLQQQASNGNMMPSFQAFQQQPSFHAQLPGMVQNDYAAPWSTAALAAGHTLTPQQRAMIYGGVHSQSPQSPQSPLSPWPQAQQTQNQYSPMQQQQQQQQQPPLRTPPPWQDDSEMEGQQQLQGGYQAPAQWGAVNGPQPWSVQQEAMMYGSHSNAGSMIPPFPAQYDQRQQYFQQLQQGQGSYDPYRMGYGSGMQGDVFGRMHNLSLQDTSQYMQNRPVGGQYKQSTVPFQQVSPPKPENPADKLFEDLVDLRSMDAKFKAAGLVGNIARPSSSKVGS